ncbi:mCG142186 [Mus musculus]|nr:mCG142186 [Mus musculus]
MDLEDERWTPELAVLTAQPSPAAGGLFCLGHSDLPRPDCRWEPDQKNAGRS